MDNSVFRSFINFSYRLICRKTWSRLNLDKVVVDELDGESYPINSDWGYWGDNMISNYNGIFRRFIGISVAIFF